ncbi:hypothetical protein PISL3812_06982 [Talaromyces islandicus]|uniref:Uncharacterized protein n=1 Tax=Talaromyces islandicus TaxID=28573 RepID=A0A0U1M2W5_TALIS|nr:hypothetical protein PISL3812_06982 [Talaromyces islandicus]
MDIEQFIPDVLCFAGEIVSQVSQFGGQTINDVGCGTATFIHDVADTSEAITEAVTETGLDFTNGVADCIRAVRIAPLSDIAADIVEGSVEMAAGAVNMGVGLPIMRLEITRSAPEIWKRIRVIRAWLYNVAYDVILEKMKNVSLPDALLLAIVMVIFRLVTISFMFVVSTIMLLRKFVSICIGSAMKFRFPLQCFLRWRFQSTTAEE